VNVWEHLTTRMCHRCHETTKTHVVPLHSDGRRPSEKAEKDERRHLR